MKKWPVIMHDSTNRVDPSYPPERSNCSISHCGQLELLDPQAGRCLMTKTTLVNQRRPKSVEVSSPSSKGLAKLTSIARGHRELHGRNDAGNWAGGGSWSRHSTRRRRGARDPSELLEATRLPNGERTCRETSRLPKSHNDWERSGADLSESPLLSPSTGGNHFHLRGGRARGAALLEVGATPPPGPPQNKQRCATPSEAKRLPLYDRQKRPLLSFRVIRWPRGRA